jgi:hypothetical protein
VHAYSHHYSTNLEDNLTAIKLQLTRLLGEARVESISFHIKSPDLNQLNRSIEHIQIHVFCQCNSSQVKI